MLTGMKPILMRHWRNVLLVGLALIPVFFTLFLASPAVAAPMGNPPSTRPASPGTAYVWGASWSELGSVNVCSNPTGGWSQSNVVTAPLDLTQPNISPRTIRLCEPFWVPGNSRPSWGSSLTGFAVQGSPTLNTTAWFVGGNSASPIVFTCNTSPWGQASAVVERAGVTVFTTGGSTSANATNSGAEGVYGTVSSGSRVTITQANCPYIVSIAIAVCDNNTVLTSCRGGQRTVTWSAERWFQRNQYTDTSPIQNICSVSPNAAITLICGTAAGGVALDGSNIHVACPSPPIATWGDFTGWLPEWIGYYAQCLTDPLNGFDRTGQAKSAWDQSAFGTIVNGFNEMTDILNIPSQCGVLGGIPFLGGSAMLEVDTCTWADTGFVTPLRTVIGTGIIILGAFWLWTEFSASFLQLFGMKRPTFGTDGNVHDK